MKRRIAVFFGGRSPEHDISVITALQALDAIDQEAFTVLPVYITTRGEWLTGAPLSERKNYLPSAALRAELTEVTLDVTAGRGHGRLLTRHGDHFSRAQAIEFDVALLAFHGQFGEDGAIQGLFELANIPYTGMRPLASSVLMDKVFTKRALSGLGIPLLPYAVIERPAEGLLPDRSAVEHALGNMVPPWCVKPVHLGSSIGVALARSVDDLRAALPPIFRLDSQAIVEPLVTNLAEYNIAVTGTGGTVRTSAIERPKSSQELLDFRQKYLSSTPGQQGLKTLGESSEGMLSLTRDINPVLDPAMEQRLRGWASEAFRALNGTGAPRIDFMRNESTGEIWLNEINACPGSFGYFLWQAAPEPVLFTEFLTSLIDEAVTLHRRQQLPDDPTPQDARILRRP